MLGLGFGGLAGGGAGLGLGLGLAQSAKGRERERKGKGALRYQGGYFFGIFLIRGLSQGTGGNMVDEGGFLRLFSCGYL